MMRGTQEKPVGTMENSGSTAQGNPKVSPASAKVGNYRWFIIALGFIITLINYLDRSALAYTRKALIGEFGINDADFGMILSAFAITYMVMTTVGGIMVDKWGAHKVWPTAAILWSAVTAMMGLASGMWVLFAFRLFLGVVEGPHFPALTRAVADWLPTNERARATAIGLAAVPFAHVVGGPLITSLIGSLGWKGMFVVLGALGVVWSVAWVFLFRDYPESCPFVSDAELNHIREGKSQNREISDVERRSHHLAAGKTTWKFMLLNPSLMSNNIAFFSFGYLLFFSMNWLPSYLEKTYHMNLHQVGWFVVAPWLTAAILLAAAGFVSDLVMRKTGSARLARTHMIWVCQLISALSFIPLMFTQDLNVAMVMMSLGIGIGLMPNSCFYALNTDLAKDRAATSLGIMDSFFALGGILAPLVTGQILQRTGSFQLAIGLVVFFSLMSVIGIILFQKPDRDMEAAKGT
ncbi:MAG TPA: MFS transporter [Candidatus Melainabacteria bacterium]|nr:MFS transporter [Candidatus Melainabacteria bacterium]